MTRRTLYSGPGASGRRVSPPGTSWGAGWFRPAHAAAVAAADIAPISGRGIELRKRHGIWHVTRDGDFAGDFVAREPAERAVAAAQRALGHLDGPGPVPRDDWRTNPVRPTARHPAKKGRRHPS